MHKVQNTRPGATTRDRGNEPATSPLGDPPEHWHDLEGPIKIAKLAIWAEIKGKVADGVLMESDFFTVELLTDLIYQRRFGRGLTSGELAAMQQILAKTGMNPADRSKVAAAPAGGEGSANPWDDV